MGRGLLSQLNGKVAIVTGGGRGIGRAHALALAKAGAAVVVNDVGREFSGDGEQSIGPAEQVVQEITASGGRAVADGTDISDWDAVGGIVDKAVSAFGRLDIVVNNAGIARFGTIEAVTRKDWDQTIATNLTGTAALCHWAAKHWRAQGPEAGRRIINTSSAVGLTPMAGNPMYVAAKAGVAAITASTAIELADLGVRANAIAPVARSRISEFVASDYMAPVAEGFDAMSPDHISTLVVYLASPECRFTGRTIGVVGDYIHLFDGWTVSADFDNGRQNWTVDGLAAALEKFPLQQNGQGQSIGGVVPNIAPAQATLDLLAEVERR